jgi:hypoxanthine phosphoribosyltransferase
MKFLRISWSKTQKLCEQLAESVSSYSPEVLVGVSRGGLVPVRLLSDILGIHSVGIMRVEFYSSLGQSAGFPRITQDVSIDLEGKRVLVVDDVSDTGRSLQVAKDHLLRKGAKEVRFATLHFKPHSVFKPDFYIDETDRWIVYPWETNEVKRELEAKQ